MAQRVESKDSLDDFPTPPWATRALIEHIIFYYGQCSIGKPFSLTKDELDQHFEFEVAKYVEEVNELFRRRLYDLLTN